MKASSDYTSAPGICEYFGLEQGIAIGGLLSGKTRVPVWRRCGQPRWQDRPVLALARSASVAGVCHGVCVDEDLWDAYDRMGLSFWQHAADSAYNAHYDRPAVLAVLGPVAGRQILDAA